MLSIYNLNLSLPFSFFADAATEDQATMHTKAKEPDAATPDYSRNRKRKADSDYVMPTGKKARLANSRNEADFSGSPWDTTFVDTDTDTETKSGCIHKSIDPRFDFDAGSASDRDIVDGILASTPAASPDTPTDAGYELSNERHEWELRWFVCVHHAAFTAATAMSLRQEIRRRKTIWRMWRELKNENTALKSELERLAECRGMTGEPVLCDFRPDV